MFKKTRVVALNGGFVAQFREGWLFESVWLSYDNKRNGAHWQNMNYVLENCVHETLSAAMATLILMTPVEV